MGVHRNENLILEKNIFSMGVHSNDDENLIL